jgi:CHAT domain-containing protein
MYEESLFWTNESIKIFNEKKSDKTIDKVYFEEDKAEIYLINAQSKFYIAKTKDSTILKGILHDVDHAIKAIEEKKISINAFEDIRKLIEDNTTVFDFAKQIHLELYNQTKNTTYLNKTISLHESALYNRIRARLNTKPNISFSNIPKHIADRETKLRILLNNKEANLESMMLNNDKWHNFLDTLKSSYPKYYKMRYATLVEPLNNIHENIPDNTTVVRYIFVQDDLYVVVISATDKYILKLNNENIGDHITQLGTDQSNIETTSLILHELYLQLWKSLESKIVTENVIIIPDGELFNLSFESLTPTRIQSFKEIATNSLLARHNISYNYSLLLLDTEKKVIDYKNDFVAFAPEFTAKMKQDYSLTITDSLSIDKTYLSLLPQPFSVDLAKEYSRLFNGNFFINENASKQIFTHEANEHKIIHIGTHAESNNITPELSRLIFAKNNSDEDNSLYTYEIYNASLNSNLAILTACETGKPTYQAGEGMISLAHAFNYAGSESILTSLWKIDEQSSAIIIELFYNNIKQGLPKDEALKQAKLTYLFNAEGRTMAPHYWAGLVLIGDAAPIDLKASSNFLWLVISALLIILATIFILKTRRK